jgi:hypothetical protein
MPNLPNNQIVLGQSERGTYMRESIETWETGAHEWRSLVKENPSYFHAVPHKDGKFSIQEYQANGHLTEITNSSKITQQDSVTDGTTQNKQSQVGGGERNVNGQGSHRERGADDTKAVAGSSISIDKNGLTNLSQQSGHHGVKGDYGFYVKGGGYSIGSEKDMVVTSQKTIHMEAEKEVSLKGKQNMGLTTKGKLTLDSTGSMLANTADTFTANSAGDMTLNTQAAFAAVSMGDMSHDTSATHTITAATEILLQVGGSYISIKSNKIKMESEVIEVNHYQMEPSSRFFL